MVRQAQWQKLNPNPPTDSRSVKRIIILHFTLPNRDTVRNSQNVKMFQYFELTPDLIDFHIEQIANRWFHQEPHVNGHFDLQ